MLLLHVVRVVVHVEDLSVSVLQTICVYMHVGFDLIISVLHWVA